MKTKISCPSAANMSYGINPQEQDEPDTFICDQCGQITSIDEECLVKRGITGKPMPWDNYFRLCCQICYDEVCDEEGYEPQENCNRI